MILSSKIFFQALVPVRFKTKGLSIVSKNELDGFIRPEKKVKQMNPTTTMFEIKKSMKN